MLVSNANTLGPGKLVGRDGDDLVLEYFDTPGQDPNERHRETVPRASLKRFTLTPELRVFWLANARWRSGRVVEITAQRDICVRGHEWEGYIAEKDLFVRGDRPLTDPVGFASAGLLESPLLADMRRPFLQSILTQRSAAHGMRGVLSSCVELYKHQIETVWRVLQDPVQRYLLADEVGLGKTIETGLIIRQLLLDNSRLKVQLVLPPFLVEQWRRELINKFRVHDFPNARILFARDDEPNTWRRADLVVVDEAHNLARLANSQQEELSARYDRLAEIATASPRLLLLSATPALHNEEAFLSMLKWLDPAVYRETTVEDLSERLQRRAGLGRLFLGLQPGLPGVLLRNRLAEIDTAFPKDAEVTALITRAKQTIEERDQDALLTAIDSLRTHVSEVYRVHRRMLRTRRTAALEGSYRVTGRLRPEAIPLKSPIILDVTRLLDNWRQEALAAREFDQKARHEAASALATAVSLSLDPDGLRRWARTQVAATQGEQDALNRIDSDLRLVSRQFGISRPLADALTYRFGSRERVVVFCPTPDMAAELAAELRKLLPNKVFQHVANDPPTASEKAVRTFEQTRSASILVADSSAEEGRNLQFTDLLVHVGLPTGANRLEQRIGRCDRWDVRRDGKAWRSYWVAEPGEAESFAAAWMRILTDGFGVFDKSVASLQRAVDLATDAAWQALFDRGLDATSDAIETVRAILEDEVERVREQDALDSMESPADGRSVYGQMMAFEDQSSSFADLTDALLSSRRAPGNLRFEPVGDPVHTIGGYEPIGRLPGRQAQIPLVPAWRLQRDFLPLSGHRGTFVRTVAVEGEDVRLYRYGDQFIDAVSDFLWNDDRGRAFGMWRWLPDWPRAECPVYRFDYAIEANPLEVTSETDELDLLAAVLAGGRLDRASLRRRADGIFPPLIVTVWIDEDGNQLSDERHLNALRAPYTKPAIGRHGGDYALNRERIERAYELVPAERWGKRWRVAESSAQHFVRSDDVVLAAQTQALAIAEADVATRLSQLRLRAARSEGTERAFLEEELGIEAMVGQTMTAAIRMPSLRLDSTGVVIVSGRGFEEGRYA
ncbi:protein DpdE [Nonomuraea angiospora]|uniref:protein DpdE n=1 Tax=Nonomuraea angiospora TaxID=46172 RepID=UPI0029A02233|nr:protein DpdE [Nonomuraea angiospora]MDX3106008.1 protein DpdE [Nonomuraea angiospora]